MGEPCKHCGAFIVPEKLPDHEMFCLRNPDMKHCLTCKHWTKLKKIFICSKGDTMIGEMRTFCNQWTWRGW